MGFGPQDFTGEVSLVLDPKDMRTGVYYEGELLDVLDAGAWDEAVEDDFPGGKPRGETAAGMVVLQYLIATDKVPEWVVRYRVRQDWRSLLEPDDPEDEMFAMQFEAEWVEYLGDFLDLVEPVSEPVWLKAI